METLVLENHTLEGYAIRTENTVLLLIKPKKSSWSLIRAAQPCGSGSE